MKGFQINACYTDINGMNWLNLQMSLQWRHIGRDGVSNHQPHPCLLNRVFRRRSNKTSKLRVTGLCAWNSPVGDEFLAQMASNAEIFSIWRRHHAYHTTELNHQIDLYWRHKWLWLLPWLSWHFEYVVSGQTRYRKRPNGFRNIYTVQQYICKCKSWFQINHNCTKAAMA